MYYLLCHIISWFYKRIFFITVQYFIWGISNDVILITCANFVGILRGVIDFHCFSDIFFDDKFNPEVHLFPVSCIFLPRETVNLMMILKIISARIFKLLLSLELLINWKMNRRVIKLINDFCISLFHSAYFINSFLIFHRILL